jgi:hypothetical protein
MIATNPTLTTISQKLLSYEPGPSRHPPEFFEKQSCAMSRMATARYCHGDYRAMVQVLDNAIIATVQWRVGS